MLLLKKLSRRPKKLDQLKKIDKLPILPRKWKRESPNSKRNTSTFG